MAQKIIIIDGNSLLFRAYYATAYGDPSSIMRTKNGTPTNAIFAFANMLAKILQSFKGGESLFIGFDTDKETFRKQEFKDYKANRAPCPEDLKPQFPISRELCQALGITYFEEHGVEADDICGTVATLASAAGYEVLIYTSDKDYLQLIDKNTKVSLLKTGLSNMEVLDSQGVQDKFGFAPAQIVDYKGLCGDTSDNYPGIPGIGDKTAVKLLKEYGTFAKIMEAAPTIKGKLGENIRSNMALGQESYRLATIKRDVKLPFSLQDLLYSGYDFASMNTFAQKYEFKQLLTRLPMSLKKGSIGANEVAFKELTSLGDLQLSSPIGLALDIDFSLYHDEAPHGIAIANKEGAYYFSLENAKKDAALLKLLGDPTLQKCVYDGKATLYALHKNGIALSGIKDDLLLSAYLLDSSVNSNPDLVYSSFGVDVSVPSEESISLLGEEHEVKKTSLLAYYALMLAPKAEQSLRSVDAYNLYHEVEMPLMEVLAKMEEEGFPIHKDKLQEFGKVFSKKRDALQEEIFAMAGMEFNLNSPSQVASVFYERLAIPGPKDQSTSVDVLNGLAPNYPIVSKLLEYRKYAKLLSTYINGLVPHIKSDGKIHSYFNQAQTSTGRLSSSSPNLQNISARDEEGRQIRQAFYYDDDENELLSLDYGQIELRILAALSHCQAYIDVFNSNRDVHSETAKKIFHVDTVTPLLRRRAKAVNFAIIYGTTVYGLAEQIEGTAKEASEIIRSFYSAYPEVGAFLNQVIKDAETKGYVTTMFGRRRYLREVNDPNYAKREAARRAALNAPVQGSAADLIKMAMVKIDQFLSEGHYQTKLVLQIHDELIFKVPKSEIDEITPHLADIMTHAVSLPVKLTVEIGKGKTWFDAKD